MKPGMGQHPTDAVGRPIQVCLDREDVSFEGNTRPVKAARRRSQHRQAGEGLPAILAARRGEGLRRFTGSPPRVVTHRALFAPAVVQRRKDTLKRCEISATSPLRQSLSVPRSAPQRITGARPGGLPIVAGVCKEPCSSSRSDARLPDHGCGEQGRLKNSREGKQLAKQHLAGLNARIAELTEMRDTLVHRAQHCRGDSRPECPIPADLAASRH